MGYDLDTVEFRAGDPIRAADMMTLVDALRRPMAVARGGAGVDVRQGARGQVHVSASSRDTYIAAASGTIPARSGTTPGAGTLSILVCDGGDYGDGGTMPVVNDGHGLADQQRCRMVEDGDGNRWAVPSPTAYSCVPSGGIAAATGSPAGDSPGSLGGQTVYALVGGAWAALPGTYAVANTFAAAFAAGKRLLVQPTDDPGIFMGVDQSC